MKKTLIALAAISAVAAFAQTTDGKPGVQLQGNFNGGWQANSYKGVKVNGIDQNGAGTSQVNIRVLEDLGGGMAAYGRIENDFSFMNNAANQGVIPGYSAVSDTNPSITTTNINVAKTTSGIAGTWGNGELAAGLRGPFGDVAFGALNNAGLNYIVLTALPTQGTSFGGGYGMVLGADPSMANVRWANSLRYITPTFGGFQASFITAMKQNSATVPVSSKTGVAPTTTSLGVGLNNQIGAKELGLKFAQGPLTAAAVFTQTSFAGFCGSPTTTTTVNTSKPGNNTVTANNPCFVSDASTDRTLASNYTINGTNAVDASQDTKQTSLAASYKLESGWLLSAAMQNTTLGTLGSGVAGANQSDRKATVYNAQYTTGPHMAFASVGQVKENVGVSAGINSKFFGFGYNYALSKNTALVARYESFQDDANVLGLKSGDVSAYTSTQGTTSDTKRIRSQFGIITNF